jgi:LemA protein
MTAMSPGQLVALGVGAALVFWMVGAYNRLLALRNTIAGAWGQLDEQLRLRGDLLPALVDAVGAHLPAEQHAFDAVLAAQLQVRAAADALRARPVQTDGAASLAAAEGVLDVALARLGGLLDPHPLLREEQALADVLAALHEGQPRLAFARQRFNDAVDAYNAAARQFPTTIVAWLFGLRAAGRV